MKKRAVWLLIAAVGPGSLPASAQETPAAEQETAPVASQVSNPYAPHLYYGPSPAYDPWAHRYTPRSAYRYRDRTRPHRAPRYSGPPWSLSAFPPAPGMSAPFAGPVQPPVTSAPARGAHTSAPKPEKPTAEEAVTEAAQPSPDRPAEAPPPPGPQAAQEGLRPMAEKSQTAGIPRGAARATPVDVRQSAQGVLINGEPPVFRPMGR
jgi:hypothetical protein